MNRILERAKELNPEIIAHRRQIHKNPELGLELPNTFSYVWERLCEMGYEPERIGGYGIAATAGNGEKTFLIRADMDALPIQEETGLLFSSKVQGVMHACGHDCHTAMMLGAAKLLKEFEDQLKGKVRIFFQSGEEILDGAKEAVEAGILENPHVDAGMMLHIMSGTPIKEGSVCFLTSGGCYASADWFRIDVCGKGGHGAMPENTISSVNTICAINSGIQDIMSVVVPPSNNACMTVGEIHAGELGSGNVIPDSAYLSGTIRTFDETVRLKIKEALVTMSDHTAKARGAKANVTFSHSAPVLINDKDMKRFSIDNLNRLLGETYVLDMEQIFGGAYKQASTSEDFAYIAKEIPCVIALLAAGTPEHGYKVASHNPKTDFNESVFYVGSAAYASIASGWLDEHSRS